MASVGKRCLVGKVCLVTGASRGIGRGIALQLGQAGATVYITGRTLKPPQDSIGGSLQETAKEIEDRGGSCVPVVCDHTKDEQIEAVFKKIKEEQNGQLDVLVNNAYAAVQYFWEGGFGKKFYELEPEAWDITNNVGLRNHYFCSVYAARLMVPRKQGLIVNISSPGGLKYLFNVPYGVGKEACDRMAADCAYELKDSNVAMVSLWPMAVQTEKCLHYVDKDDTKQSMKNVFKYGESTEFSGKCIVSLASDPFIMEKTGKIVHTGELADEYNITDIDGSKPPAVVHFSSILHSLGWKRTAAWTPRFLKMPKWMLAVASSKM